jgi:hypothetical protein
MFCTIELFANRRKKAKRADQFMATEKLASPFAERNGQWCKDYLVHAG